MSTETPAIIHIEDAYVRYTNQTGAPFTVLNDIDLKVSSGEFVTVVGPSGCGKSTLLRLMLGSETPSSGRVLFFNEPIVQPERNRGIVFQKYSLFPHLTVMENLVFGLAAESFTLFKRWRHPVYFRHQCRDFQNQAREYLIRVGLEKHEDKYPHQLSGGMQQRVAIAQSLIIQPKILLMDEPFGALDYSTRQDMQLYILEAWQKNHMTVVFVTHDLEEALFLGTRTIVLSQYYDTDAKKNEGAKIVTDISLPEPYPKPIEFKFCSLMKELVEKLRFGGMEPEHHCHIRDFELTHKDSFRTVCPGEMTS